MKRILIITLFTFLNVPCLAQWKYASTNGQVLAFGVHDTSLFKSFEGHLSRLHPNGEADTGLDFTQGNFTTFASAGPNFFVGSYNPTVGYGVCALSTNNGSSWKTVVGGPVGSNGTYLFSNLGTYPNGDSSVVARSTDRGKTWQRLYYPPGLCYVGTGAIVYTNTPRYGVLRSLDSGFTWSQAKTPFNGSIMMMGTLLFLYQNYRSLVEGEHNGVLILSKDSGMTWDTVHVDSAGKPEYITYLATDGKNLFAGGVSSRLDQGAHIGNGLYVSTDTGQHWRAVNDGLTSNMNIEAIGIYPLDSTIYVSTNNNNYGDTSGISYATYYRPIREIVDTPKSAVRPSAPVSDTLAIYPNPATGVVTIFAGSTIIERVSVLSVLGVEVLTLDKRGREPGGMSYNSEITLDLSHLPSGTYFLRIQTAAGSVLRKVIRE